LRNLIKSLSLAVALIAPVALHATPLTGQFSIDGTVTNTGTVLNFVPGTAAVGTGTQTGSFASLLTAGQLLTSGPATINYTPYVPGSAVFTVGSLTATLESLVATNFSLGGATITAFVGDALFTAAGFDTTAGTISFSTQGSGPVTFSATGLATASQVPEPSTLALFGTGALGLAGLVSRKLMA
jgi:hypothetical protein